MLAHESFSTTPYYEMAARDLLRRFGPDTLALVDMAIEQLSETGPEGDLAIWRELRVALLRTSPAVGSVIAH